MSKVYDYLIIGAGVIGLALAKSLKEKYPDKSVCLLDKETEVAQHASGRNSGVLHAGFYYTADSLKARFTVDGNYLWKKFCRQNELPINECGKLVVAQNEYELNQLFELESRGKVNGSNVKVISEDEARLIDPNVKTYQKALWSPDTASIDPTACCLTLKALLKKQGVEFVFNAKYQSHKKNVVETSAGNFEGKIVINSAGLYADKVAHDFGFGKKYTLIPFKGLYLKYTKNKTDLKTNIYPVPNLKNPFLGVHYTITVDQTIKIGPTAIPSFWREHYGGFANFSFRELVEVVGYETALFLTNAFGFRSLAFEEMKKYSKDYFINLALQMVQSMDKEGFTEWSKPGIRAQLLDKTSYKLVQDFVVEADEKSVHVLNAVSPAFTCAFPFADYLVANYIKGY